MPRMGRPKLIDLKQLKALMRLKPTLQDTAHFFECDTSTVEKTVKREFGVTYSEFRDQNMVHTRFSLIRKALQMAEAGDRVMLIFCLKNQCGWTDKIQHSTDEEKPFKLAYDTNNQHA